MSLPFERSLPQENIPVIPKLQDPRNQNGRWECKQCKQEYHMPPVQGMCTICRGEVVRSPMDLFQRHGQPRFNLYTPVSPQIQTPNQLNNNSQSDRPVIHTNGIPNLCYIATVEAPDECYDVLSAAWFTYRILILLRNSSPPFVSYKEFGALLKGVKGSLLKDILSSMRERAVCLHDYQLECFRGEPYFNRIKTSFICLRLFMRVCAGINLTPPDYIEQLFYTNTDDPLVYSLPTLDNGSMPNQPIIREPIRAVPNGTMRPMLPPNFQPPNMPHCNTFSMPPLRHRPPVPYLMPHNKANFTPRKPKLNIPQSINNYSPDLLISPRLTIDNNNNTTFKSVNLIGHNNDVAHEMQLGNSIGPTLSEDLYKHPLPRGCLPTKSHSSIINIPESSNGCHEAATPDTPSMERLDSVSTPSPAPLTPVDIMDINESLPDARILHLPEGQDIILLMKSGEPHLATPLLYIVFPQLKRHHIDCTKNRQDLNLQPKNSTQLEVRMLREFGMVGRKTFRCLLFSFKDVAKMVRKVDVAIPDCIQRVIDGEIPEERASILSPVKLGNGFINKPVGNPDKQKQKQNASSDTMNETNSSFDWSIEEEQDIKLGQFANNYLTPIDKRITPFLASSVPADIQSGQTFSNDGLTIDTVVLNNFDLSSLPKFIDLPPILPSGLEELGAEFYSASEGQFYSALTEEMGRVALLALSFRGFMICLKELYLNYLSQAGNRHTMKFKMRKLGITSLKATSWQRHKLVDLKALPNLCSICGLITLSEAKRLCGAYKYPFPVNLDKLIALTDKKCKSNNQLFVSIPLCKLDVRPRTPEGVATDVSSGEESETANSQSAVGDSDKKRKSKEEKSNLLKHHLSHNPLNNSATPTRAPKTPKLIPNNTIGTKKCKECGLIQSRFAKKCSQCHAYLQGSPCPKCQKLNIAYYSHCYSCFTKLDKIRNADIIKPRGRISKKKLIQGPLVPVPISQTGTITPPPQVSCIRCGKIKLTGKFNCLRCGTMFNVSSESKHSNHMDTKECVVMEMDKLCNSNPDFKLVLELYECLKQLDLISVLSPLVSKIRTETLQCLEKQEYILNDLESQKSLRKTELVPNGEKDKLELKLSKLTEQQSATIQEIAITNQKIQTNKQTLIEKENKITDKQRCIQDCEKFIQMLPKS